VSDTQLLLEGIYFGEGPRWRDGRLWFSDFYARTVNSVGPGGDARVELRWDERTSGLGWMPDGSLLFVSMKRRALFRRWPDGRVEQHADLSAVHADLSNDMVVDAEGRAYVGNFGFDLHGELRARGDLAVMADHPTAALALVQLDGSVEVAAEGLHFPNGIVITPDGGTLIVGETLGAMLTAFTIGESGRLSDRRLWAMTMTDLERPRVPDGICLDAEGAVWIASATAPECIRLAEGGEVLAVVTASQNVFACMLGGEDGRTLFMMTAPTSEGEVAARAPFGRIETAEVSVARAGWP
jgi:sugar lactone lactonase YvrE